MCMHFTSKQTRVVQLNVILIDRYVLICYFFVKRQDQIPYFITSDDGQIY